MGREYCEPDCSLNFRETEKWLLHGNDDLVIGANKFTGTPITFLVYPLVFLVPADFCLTNTINS